MSTTIQTTIWLERNGIERPFEVTGDFVVEQREIRYPIERAQPQINAHFENVTIMDQDGDVLEDDEAMEIAEEALFKAVEGAYEDSRY